MSQSRNGQVVRQWVLLRALRSRRLTLPELARVGEVTTRTIRRDLDALEQARFPIVRRGDCYALSEDFL